MCVFVQVQNKLINLCVHRCMHMQNLTRIEGIGFQHIISCIIDVHLCVLSTPPYKVPLGTWVTP